MRRCAGRLSRHWSSHPDSACVETEEAEDIDPAVGNNKHLPWFWFGKSEAADRPTRPKRATDVLTLAGADWLEVLVLHEGTNAAQFTLRGRA